MRRATIGLFGFVLALGVAIPALAQELTPQDVRSAIDKGVKYLRSRQQADGSWIEWPNQPGGVTAMVTLALLNSGVPADDPQIQRALDRLRRFQPTSTYATSLQTMAFCRAQPSRDAALILRNVRWLEAKQVNSGPRKGAWSYPLGTGDNSNSQFALLALHEAEQVGIAVTPQTWRLAKAYWDDCQNLDGSWGYYKGQAGTGSMTCAGITSMVITEDRVGASDAAVEGDRIDCCGQSRGGSPQLERGLDWLARNFTVNANPGAQQHLWLLYYLYGVERTGRLTARRFFGGHDWYREGCDLLVRRQDGLSGYWKGTGHAEDAPEIATSLVLLFLSKGRWPILMAKLKHTSPADWSRHRNDVGNLTRFVEGQWKQDMVWQTMDLKMANVDDLIQAPVLYFCGSTSPLPPAPRDQDALAAKLRDYLDRGGFIFAEAYCGGTGFDEGFRALMQKVFPEPEYRLRLLQPEHPIWHAEKRVPPKYVRALEGIDFGCRTSVVYVPMYPRDTPWPSLSCLWELARAGREAKYSPPVQEQIQAALAIGINVLAYATNRELQDKDLRRADQQISAQAKDPVDRGRMHVATLRHGGGCSVAPRALPNLLEATGRELQMRVDVHPELLAISDPALFNFHLVFMHGRSSFRLTDGERKQLRLYLERGGMLFADAICSNPGFIESFRREMAAIFPDKPLQPIPAADPLFTPHYGGFDVTKVTRRDPQIRAPNDPLKSSLRRVAPALEAVTIDGRYGVIFSPYDLSCALEKQDSLECQGYVRDDAARLGLNVVLYSLHE